MAESRHCLTCGRRIRRWSESSLDAPGTVPHGARGECGTCYQLSRGGNAFQKYGLSRSDLAQMIVDQRGCCAACGLPFLGNGRMNVDHDHATGRVRGLLCSGCNSAEGHLLGDPERARRLAAYMEQQRLIAAEAEVA